MSTVQWKARPTVYRGIPMRSRLEASYAAKLDKTEFEWVYEPRAYGAPGRQQYLPDFELRLPGMTLSAYVEVKPTLELAYLAMERMTVIWDSEPRALLFVVVPPLGLDFCADPRDGMFRKVVRPD